MADILKKIIETKKTEVAQLKADMSLHELHHQAAAAPAPAGLAAALKAASVSGYGLIAELKKASPSILLIDGVTVTIFEFLAFSRASSTVFD